MTACEHCAHEPSYHHRERLQQPYRGQWQAIIAWEAAQNPHGLPTPLRVALHAIVDARPDRVEARAVNTTEYGREG